MSKSKRVLTVALLAIGICGCDSLRPGQKSAVRKYDSGEQVTGRYQMIVAGTKILKLDTATGQTWELEDSRWESIPTESTPNCVPTPQDPCTNVWLYKDPDHIREAPSVGTVQGGYRFKGGDANSIGNWESAPGVPSTNPFRK